VSRDWIVAGGAWDKGRIFLIKMSNRYEEAIFRQRGKWEKIM
jgi:hypothetical protein